eukprot:scaffold83586_cov37-Prasinocladus_malaysianus.AAC.1
MRGVNCETPVLSFAASSSRSLAPAEQTALVPPQPHAVPEAAVPAAVPGHSEHSFWTSALPASALQAAIESHGQPSVGRLTISGELLNEAEDDGTNGGCTADPHSYDPTVGATEDFSTRRSRWPPAYRPSFRGILWAAFGYLVLSNIVDFTICVLSPCPFRSVGIQGQCEEEIQLVLLIRIPGLLFGVLVFVVHYFIKLARILPYQRRWLMQSGILRWSLLASGNTP